MKFIVAGGRDFKDRGRMSIVIDTLLNEDDTILSGMAHGADQLARVIGNKLGHAVEEHPANWDEHGRSAGPIRNQQMAQNADALIAFWDGKSRGTKDMIKKAIRCGLEIHIYRY